MPPDGVDREVLRERRQLWVAAMSFVLATRVAPSAQIGRNTIAATEWFDLAVEARPLNARQLRAQFQQWLQTRGVPVALVDDLVLAVYEALANVVEHAYPPDHPQPMMRLQARV